MSRGIERIATVVAVLAVALAVVLVVTVVAVGTTHRRDEAGYLTYLGRWGGATEKDRVELSLHPPPAGPLLSAGDEACDWMATQGLAFWRGDPAFGLGAAYEAFAATHAYDTSGWGDVPIDPYAVTMGAWQHLCADAGELATSHRYPWDRPSD